MRNFYPIVGACAAILLVAGSQQNDRRAPGAPQGFPGQARGTLQQQRANDAVSENEWEQIVNWMQIHCPNQIDFYLHRLENRPVQQAAVKKRIVELYRQLNAVRNDNLLKQAMVHHAEAQDKVFGASIDFREAWQNDRQRLPLAQQNLRAATEQLIDAEIDVKQARVQRLQNELTDMAKRKQQIVAERLNQQIRLAKNPAPGPRATGDAIPVEPEKP